MIGLALFCSAALAHPPETETQETPRDMCWRLAAHPLDLDNPPDIAGVYTAKVDVDAALPPCKAAFADDPDSAQLTSMLGQLRHIRREYTEAERLYRHAAKQDLAVAKLRLVALADTYGYNAKSDDVEAWAKAARDAYRPEAEAGDPRAMEALGWVAALGPDGPDKPTVLDWSLRSLKAGRIDAVYPISISGIWTEDLSDDALAAVEAAATAGSSLAMRVYGKILSEREDYEAAAVWYERSWNAGEQTSLYSLSRLYRGDLEDDALELKWDLIKAEELGGRYWVYVARDYARSGQWEKADELLERAARDDENIDAMVALAELHAKYSNWHSYAPDARPRPEDEEKSIYWASRSAELGSADGAYLLGTAYWLGYGVESNRKLAFFWFEKAAKQNHSGALYDLGGMYSRTDRSKAIEYYLRVYNQASTEAPFAETIESDLNHLGFTFDNEDDEAVGDEPKNDETGHK